MATAPVGFFERPKPPSLEVPADLDAEDLRGSGREYSNVL